MNDSTRPCAAWEAVLHEYIDGDLAAAEEARLLHHIEDCADCQQAAESLHELRLQAAELARPVAPERDLWPEIEARLGREAESGNGSPRLLRARSTSRPVAERRWTRTLAVAASLLLLTLTGLAAVYLLLPGAPTTTPSKRTAGTLVSGTADGILPAASPSGSDFRQVELEFNEARRQLREALDQRRDQLSPTTMEVVERNLDLIDQAIQEIRQALEQDPENLELRQLLTASYQREVQLLQRVTRLPFS